MHTLSKVLGVVVTMALFLPLSPAAAREGGTREKTGIRLSAAVAQGRVRLDTWVTVRVKIANMRRKPVRAATLRLVHGRGIRLQDGTVRLGTIRGKTKRIERVSVMLTASEARTLVIRAKAGGRVLATARVRLRPEDPQPPVIGWTGNFATPTENGLSFHRRGAHLIRGFRAAEIPGWCEDGIGGALDWYPNAVLPAFTVALDGTFDKTFVFRPSDTTRLRTTVRIRGRISGEEVVGGRLDLTAAVPDEGPLDVCTISNDYGTWAAQQN